MFKGTKASMLGAGDENTDDGDAIVDCSMKALVAAYKRTETFCGCLPISLKTCAMSWLIPSSCTRKSTVQGILSKMNNQQSWQDVSTLRLIIGDDLAPFGKSGSRLRFPARSSRRWSKDLENFFAAEYRFEQGNRERPGHPPHDPETVSSL